tara:strand:+ start:485 stop:649 length:165 start_codon:yes stop_codon:yes gene_type:complete
MTRKSKWTLEELESLTKIKNHRIMFDGYEYYWKRKLNESSKRVEIRGPGRITRK